MARRHCWPLPEFQSRLIRWVVLVVLVTNLSTFLIAMGLLRTERRAIPPAEQVDSWPVLAGPNLPNQRDTTLSALLLAMTSVTWLSMMWGLWYSHRLAGPLYRIRRSLEEARQGRAVPPILLRKNDEFQDLAAEINSLLAGRSIHAPIRAVRFLGVRQPHPGPGASGT